MKIMKNNWSKFKTSININYLYLYTYYTILLLNNIIKLKLILYIKLNYNDQTICANIIDPKNQYTVILKYFLRIYVKLG